MEAKSNLAFHLKEGLTWPNRGTGNEYAKIYPRIRDGLKYRQRYAKEGKADLYVSIKGGCYCLLKMPFEELQEFLQYDPLTGVILREITPVWSAGNFADLYDKFTNDAEKIGKIRPDTALTAGDLKITEFASDLRTLRDAVLCTDTNSY